MVNSQLDRRDWRFFGVTVGIALLVLLGLYTAAYLSAPPGYQFCGIIHDTHDGLGYQVWANYYAYQGLQVDNPYALQRQPGGWFNLIWWIFGRLMAAGIPFMPAFHVFRVIAGVLMYLMLLMLMREFFRDRIMAWCAYLLAGFGTGLSWLVGLVSMDYLREGFMGSDLLHGDSFPVHVFWTFPHLALSFAMMASIYLFMYRATVRRERRWALYAGLVALFMGFAHPYHFVTILPVLFCWYLALWAKHGRAFLARWPDLGILLAGMLPGLVYYKIFIGSSPNFAHWATTNVMRTAGFLNVLLGFGILVALPVLGYRGFVPVKRFTDRYLLVAIWPLVQFLFHFGYPLIFFEARLGEGLIFPFAILGTWAFYGTVLPFLRRAPVGPDPEADILEPEPAAPAPTAEDPPGSRARLAWAVGLMALTLPTTVLHMASCLREVRTGTPYFRNTVNTKMIIHKGELEALKALGKMSELRDFPLVLSGGDIGLILPGFAPVRAFLGHITQTVNYRERFAQAMMFFGPSATEESRRQLLARYGFGYVWWGLDEDNFGGRRPPASPYMTPIYNNGVVTIYRVNPGAL